MAYDLSKLKNKINQLNGEKPGKTNNKNSDRVFHADELVLFR
jgi:hypothetical protein